MSASIKKVIKKGDEMKEEAEKVVNQKKRSHQRNPNHNNSDLLSKISSIEHLARAMQEIVVENCAYP